MDIDAKLREALQPVREELRELETSIAQKQREIAELRQQAHLARRIMALIDGPPPTKKSKPSGHGVSDDAVGTVWQFVHEHIHNGVAFSYPELRDAGLTQLAEPTVNRALARLIDDGRIRLDSVGRGGRKNYKLVA